MLKTTGSSSSCDDGNDDDVQYDNGVAFREAQIMNANYVNGKEFRMMFVCKFLVGDNNNNQQDTIDDDKLYESLFELADLW